MIWLLTFGLCAAVFAYIATPLYFKTLPSDELHTPQDNVRQAYREELKLLKKAIETGDGDLNALNAQKRILEKRLLQSATHVPELSSKTKPVWTTAALIVLLGGTFGVYSLIGSPKLTHPDALTSTVANAEQPPALSPTALVAEMERDLQKGDVTVRKWGLYARALMTVGRYDDAFAAYENAIALSNDNPDIAAELESARAYAKEKQNTAETPRGPSRADVEAAAQMSAEDRAAMIQGMVDGLSQRLIDNPDDTEGWIRLLRSRKVLGQTTQAQDEITAMKVHFDGNPDMISLILRQSGWDN